MSIGASPTVSITPAMSTGYKTYADGVGFTPHGAGGFSIEARSKMRIGMPRGSRAIPAIHPNKT